MSIKELALIIIIIVNFTTALLYLIWGVIILPHTSWKGKNYSKAKYGIMFLIMILCPLVGVLFFLAGYILFRVFFHIEADLSDVIFSKERIVSNEKEDLEGKFNIASLEEAIAISDKESLRKLMMNVIKGDVQKSLASLSLALNSEDSETSHYAASVLSDELNDFRENVQKIYMKIKKEDENQSEYCCVLLKYMNGVLAQKVFTQMEQDYFVLTMEEIGNKLFHIDRDKMVISFYEWVFLRLLDQKMFELAEKWCTRSAEIYPEELMPYTCRYKLYFNMQEKEKFLQTLEEIKQSNIVIDNETLELIRIFR